MMSGLRTLWLDILMAKGLLLIDAGPLGAIANLRHQQTTAKAISNLIKRGWAPVVPAPAYYEIRRELELQGLRNSIAALSSVMDSFQLLTPTRGHWTKAAGLWAESRRKGKPSGDPAKIDFDAIIAAMAIDLGAAVLTKNVRHFRDSFSVRVEEWRQPVAGANPPTLI